MQPLLNDLRERILKAIDNHECSRRNLAARFCVNPSTITRLLQLRHQTGSCQPRPLAGGITPTLDHDALERLRTLVQETPDATLQTLKQKMGVTVAGLSINLASGMTIDGVVADLDDRLLRRDQGQWK